MANTPAAGQRQWRMPAETEPQSRIWMAFPPARETMGANAAAIARARAAWTSVAHAIAEYEPVTMIVDPVDRTAAALHLSADIERLEAPLDDAWMRDIGPTFVVDENNILGAVDWRFNGWGQRPWARWDNDRHIAGVIANATGAVHVQSSIINEGGGIAVDGQGTVLLTDSVQRDERRNPGVTRAAVETEMARVLGTAHAIWLERGLYRDTRKFGTHGHVDIVAAVPSPGVLLFHDQQDASHPDHAICAQLRTRLEASTTADGRPWLIHDVAAPTVLRDRKDFVDYSYINHLVINDAVIACVFDDPADAAALAILGEVYPGRRIVGVDARELFARGGGIHCITQQQPAVV